MDIQAEHLTAGHVIQDGGWGCYRIVKVEKSESGWIFVQATQGSVKRTFTFTAGTTVYGVL